MNNAFTPKTVRFVAHSELVNGLNEYMDEFENLDIDITWGDALYTLIAPQMYRTHILSNVENVSDTEIETLKARLDELDDKYLLIDMET